MSKLAPIGVILLGLLALAFLPSLTSRTDFSFDVEGTDPTPPWNLTQKFRVLSTPKIAFAGRSELSLEQILKSANRALMINFWATWCPPCIEELPSLAALNHQLLVAMPASPQAQDRPLPLLVAIAVDEKSEDVDRFLKENAYARELLILHDPNGEFARERGSVKFPETYLLNPKGQQKLKWVGPQEWLSKDVLDRLAHSD